MNDPDPDRMNSEPSRLTILIPERIKEAFQHTCSRNGKTASTVLRDLIGEHLRMHGGDAFSEDAPGSRLEG